MCRVEIEVSNPRNDLADRNRGLPRFRSARSFRGSDQQGHSEGWKLLSRLDTHIRSFFLHTTTDFLIFICFFLLFIFVNLSSHFILRTGSLFSYA